MNADTDFPKKNIFITGGSGFFAPHLLLGLGAKRNVILHIRDPQKAKKIEPRPGVRVISGPLSDKSLIDQIPESCEAVFHLAGAVNGPNTEAILDSNVVSTSNVLSLMQERQIRKLIFVSTASVWSDSSGIRLNEQVTPRPTTLYGHAKLAAECLIQDAITQERLASAVILRGNSTYGPGSTQGAVANFYSCLVNGQPVRIDGDGQQIREPLYVTDMVDVLVKSLVVNKGLHIYGISGNESLTVLQMAEAMARAIDRKLMIEWGPADADRTRHLLIDTGKARRELGWTPRIRFDEGGRLLFRKNSDLL